MKTNKFFWVIAMIAFMVPEMAQEIAAEEPVIITAPDTTIDKTAYTLSDQGITIAVSYGSAYPADHAYNNIDVTYFGVLANGSMTISAGENIRGIAVNPSVGDDLLRQAAPLFQHRGVFLREPRRPAGRGDGYRASGDGKGGSTRLLGGHHVLQ